MDITNILEKVKEDKELTDALCNFFLYVGAVKGKEVYINMGRMEDIEIEKRIENSNLTDEEKKQLLSFVKETKKSAYLKAISEAIEDMKEPKQCMKTISSFFLDRYRNAKKYIEDAFEKGVITGEEKEQLSIELEKTKDKYLPARLKALLSLAKDNTLANRVYFLSKAKECAAILEVDISKDEKEIKASIIEEIKEMVRGSVYGTTYWWRQTTDVSKIVKYLNGGGIFFVDIFLINIDVVQAKEIGININEIVLSEIKKNEIVLSEIKKFVEEEIKKDENIKKWFQSGSGDGHAIIKICEKLGLKEEAEELRAKFEEIEKAEAEEIHKEKLKTLYEVLGQPTSRQQSRETTLTQPPKKISSKPIT